MSRAASLQARQAARSTTRMEDIVERGYVIIGSPDEVVEQLTELATDLNVGHLMLLMQFGSMGKDLAAYNTKLFADRVLPAPPRSLLPVGGQVVAAADAPPGARRSPGVSSVLGGRIAGGLHVRW